jgi:LAS superfamily LD-carboxypeptidase LdcB
MKKYKKFLVLLIIVASAFFLSILYINKHSVHAEKSSVTKEMDKSLIYGETEISDYVSGKFSPASHPLFVSLAKESIPTDGRTHYLRIETVEALKKMLSDFSEKHPKIKIYVRSATRTYNDQANIWNSKWNANTSIKDESKRALKILQFSSMPGTSRHHWGTDFDINELTDEYYLKGNGKIIYSWLKDNAAKYGFYQPYTADRKQGYYEEKWHWSYKPLSSQFVKAWNNNFSGDSVHKLKGFFFFFKSLPMAELYVNSINPNCF